eukprot:4097643-Amphidinium_carterae.2
MLVCWGLGNLWDGDESTSISCRSQSSSLAGCHSRALWAQSFGAVNLEVGCSAGSLLQRMQQQVNPKSDSRAACRLCVALGDLKLVAEESPPMHRYIYFV